MHHEKEPRLRSRRDAAAYLGVSLRTVDRLIASRQIKTVRIGARILLPVDALDAFVDCRAAS